MTTAEQALAYYYQGKQLIAEGNIDNAVSMLKKSIELDEHPKVYELLYDCTKSYGDDKISFEYIRKAYRSGGKQDLIAYKYALELYEHGNKDESLKICREIISRNRSYKKAELLIKQITEGTDE